MPPPPRPDRLFEDEDEESSSRPANGALSPSPRPARPSLSRTVHDELVALFLAQRMAVSYLAAETRRSGKGFRVGLGTVLLVVALVALLPNSTMKSPLLFFRIAERSVGETDLVLSPLPSPERTSPVGLPVLNQTHLDGSLRPMSAARGTSGRWLFFSRVLSPRHLLSPNYTASCVLLGVDSAREQQIGLGRTWERPPLVGDSCYLSRSIVRQIGYTLEEAAGQTALLRLDIFDLAKQLGFLNSSGEGDPTVSDVIALLQAIDPVSFPDSFFYTSTSLSLATRENRMPYPSLNQSYSRIVTQAILGGSIYQLPLLPPMTIPGYLNILSEATFGNVSVTPFELLIAMLLLPPELHPYVGTLLAGQNVSVNTITLLELMLPTIINISRSDTNFTIAGVVDEPDGKWPESLGSIIVLESNTLASVVKRSLLSVLNANISSIDLTPLLGNASIVIGNITLPPIFRFPPVSLKAILSLATNAGVVNSSIENSLDAFENLDGNAQSLLSVVEKQDRLSTYIKDLNGLNEDLIAFSNAVALSVGLDYPAGVTTPIATTLTLTQYIRYFLDNIFYSVVALMVLLGALLIFSLLLHDVDSKTYEYGMLRALGMRHRTLVQVLITKSLLFAIPGIIIGLILALFANVPVDERIAAYAAVPTSYTLSFWPIVLAVTIGFIMPLMANIVPISRALSRTLRDSLDVYHHVVSDVTIRVIKLADFGLDVWQTALAVLMVVVGFITFYAVPYSFIFAKVPLFLGILNGILLGMLLGLCIIAQGIQPYLERLVLRIILCFFHRQLAPVVMKNLSAHRGRNAKTAQMFTICLAFIVFCGAMFALQAQSLIDNVRVLLAADINVAALPGDLKNILREIELTEVLYTQKMRHLAGDANSIVIDYTFLPFPINTLPGVRAVQFSSLPQFRSVRNFVYGVSENYLNVAYDEYFLTTELSDSDSAYPRTRSGAFDAIALMYQQAGQARLPEESDGIRYPIPVLSAPSDQQLDVAYNYSNNQQFIEHEYKDYVDAIIGEALRGWQSVDSHTALNIYLRSVRANGMTINENRLVKARALVSKVPGFFYSSYRVSAAISSVLIRQGQFNQLTINALGEDSPLIVNGQAPKQRLLVRVAPGSTLAQREDLINSLRTFFQSDRTVVTDTQRIIDSTMDAVDLMNLFFQGIGIITMIMCFLILWLSFTANVEENSWEFGVLRALGVNKYQAVMIYVYEALCLVLSALLLGTAIGVIIAASLTAQFNLFTEMPFHMTFPHTIFWTLVILSLIISVLGSAWPASKLLRSIATVLRGQ